MESCGRVRSVVWNLIEYAIKILVGIVLKVVCSSHSTLLI